MLIGKKVREGQQAGGAGDGRCAGGKMELGSGRGAFGHVWGKGTCRGMRTRACGCPPVLQPTFRPPAPILQWVSFPPSRLAQPRPSGPCPTPQQTRRLLDPPTCTLGPRRSSHPSVESPPLRYLQVKLLPEYRRSIEPQGGGGAAQERSFATILFDKNDKNAAEAMVRILRGGGGTYPREDTATPSCPPFPSCRSPSAHPPSHTRR
jgi:hypothetical protein